MAFGPFIVGGKAGDAASDMAYDPSASGLDAETIQEALDEVAAQVKEKTAFSVGAAAPSNTKLLWIDTNASTGGLKYYNGTAWVHVPVAYT